MLIHVNMKGRRWCRVARWTARCVHVRDEALLLPKLAMLAHSRTIMAKTTRLETTGALSLAHVELWVEERRRLETRGGLGWSAMDTWKYYLARPQQKSLTSLPESTKSSIPSFSLLKMGARCFEYTKELFGSQKSFLFLLSLAFFFLLRIWTRPWNTYMPRTTRDVVVVSSSATLSPLSREVCSTLSLCVYLFYLAGKVCAAFTTTQETWLPYSFNSNIIAQPQGSPRSGVRRILCRYSKAQLSDIRCTCRSQAQHGMCICDRRRA